MHEWKNHKQKSCLCQFTLLSATDRTWKQKNKNINNTGDILWSLRGGKSVELYTLTTTTPQQKRDGFGIFTPALAVAVRFDLTEGLDMLLYKHLSVLCTPPGLLCLFYNL